MLRITFTERFQKSYKSLTDAEKSNFETNSRFFRKIRFIRLCVQNGYKGQKTFLNSA